MEPSEIFFVGISERNQSHPFFFFFDLKVLVSKKSSIHSSVNVHVCI